MKLIPGIYIVHLMMVLFLLTHTSFSNIQHEGTSAIGNQMFFPNTPGTWWTYDVVRYPFCCPEAPVNSEVTIRVVAAETLSSGIPVSQWRISRTDSILAWDIFPFGVDTIAYVSQLGDSVAMYRSLKDTTAPEVLLRTPPALGQTWGSEGFTSFISSVDSFGAVTIPPGTFENCVHVNRYGGWWQAPIERLEWVKESLGFIKIIHTMSGLLNKEFVMTLKNYHIETTLNDESTGNLPPRAYLLLQNYPNPFNPDTEIRFQVPGSGFVSLKIFDVLGREIAKLVNEELHAGAYRVSWDATSAAGGEPSGVYFYQLSVENFVETKKLLYLK